MNKSIVLAFASAATLMMSSGAHAAPIAYRFSGQTFAADTLDGQTISGSYTYDPSLYTHFVSDGHTYGQGYVDSAPVGSAFSTFALSGGFNDSLGTAGSPFGVGFQTLVWKGVKLGDGSVVDRFELYASSVDAAGFWHVFELETQQAASAPDLIFPDAAPNDFSVTQPASFLTAGSENIGYFAVFNPSGAILQHGDFTITSISAVPETPAFALMAAGLGALSLLRRRRAA